MPANSSNTSPKLPNKNLPPAPSNNNTIPNNNNNNNNNSNNIDNGATLRASGGFKDIMGKVGKLSTQKAASFLEKTQELGGKAYVKTSALSQKASEKAQVVSTPTTTTTTTTTPTSTTNNRYFIIAIITTITEDINRRNN